MAASHIPDRFHIGVIDDDEAVRHSVRVLLELHGLKVIEFASADQAVHSPLLGDCCCLIVDMDMPGTNGLQFIENLRKAGDERPIILVTAKSHIAEPERIRRSKIAALLVKPIQQNELLAWIQHSLNATK